MQPDRDLQRELRELGSELEYPPTPDLARTVRDRLDAEAAPSRSWLSTPALRWAAVAAVVLLAAVPVLSPALRDTATGWFAGGQSGGADQAAGGAAETSQPDTQNALPENATAEETMMMEDGQASRAGGEDMPSSGGGDLPASGGGTRPEEDLGYGQRITLHEAESRLAGKELLLPELGEPDRVYAGGPSRNDGVVLVYRSGQGLPSLGDTGVGLVLTEVPGSVESAYLRGGPLAVSGVEEVSVGSGQGYWAPADRSPRPTGAEGLPGNVLLWEREGLALRLGADVSKREAIRLAESVR